MVQNNWFGHLCKVKNSIINLLQFKQRWISSSFLRWVLKNNSLVSMTHSLFFLSLFFIRSRKKERDESWTLMHCFEGLTSWEDFIIFPIQFSILHTLCCYPLFQINQHIFTSTSLYYILYVFVPDFYIHFSILYTLCFCPWIKIKQQIFTSTFLHILRTLWCCSWVKIKQHIFSSTSLYHVLYDIVFCPRFLHPLLYITYSMMLSLG